MRGAYIKIHMLHDMATDWTSILEQEYTYEIACDFAREMKWGVQVFGKTNFLST